MPLGDDLQDAKALWPYYQGLVDKYIGKDRKLKW
jgi:hypothetical protein